MNSFFNKIKVLLFGEKYPQEVYFSKVLNISEDDVEFIKSFLGKKITLNAVSHQIKGRLMNDVNHKDDNFGMFPSGGFTTDSNRYMHYMIINNRKLCFHYEYSYGTNKVYIYSITVK